MNEKTVKCALDKLANLVGYAECMLVSLRKFNLDCNLVIFSNEKRIAFGDIKCHDLCNLNIDGKPMKANSFSDAFRQICKALERSSIVVCDKFLLVDMCMDIRQTNILFNSSCNNEILMRWKFECALDGIDLDEVMKI